MKSRENAFRLKRFEAEDKRRKVAALEQMIREFEHMAAELERQVQSEEDRTGVKDRSHFAYSTLAKAAAQRRDNLRASVTNLQAKLEVAMRERNDLCADLDTAETVEQQPRDFDRVTASGQPVGAHVR